MPYADRRAHQCLGLLPTHHNFHMLEGFCAFWQTPQHAAGPVLQQPLSEDEQTVLVSIV